MKDSPTILGMPVPTPRPGKFDDKELDPLLKLEAVLNFAETTLKECRRHHGAVLRDYVSLDATLESIMTNAEELKASTLIRLYDGRAKYLKRFEGA